MYDRRLAHARDPELGRYRFQVEYLTDDHNEQMGLEQMLYEKYPEAQSANGGFNKYRAVDVTKDYYQTYRQAALDYLARQEDD